MTRVTYNTEREAIMKKSMLSFLLAAAAVSTLGSTGILAVTTTTAGQAKLIAEKQVPAGSGFLKTELDDGKYEVSFYHADQKERYEIEVSAAAGKILSYESKLTNHQGGLTVTLTEEDAKKKVTGEIPTATILSAYLDSDDGYSSYEVRFYTDSYYGEYTVHPENGTVLERDVRVGTLPSSKDTSGLISRERAAELALKAVPGSVMTDLDLDYRNNAYLYEVELYKDGSEYDITLDGKTGNLLQNRHHKEDWDDDWDENRDISGNSGRSESAGNSGNTISVEKARQIALDRVPGASVKECKLDYEDGRAIYEGELRKDNWEYEFEIDAVTGAVLKWEADYDD